MDTDKETPLILGHLFVSTAEANIDVGAGEIQLHINGKEKFEFRPKMERCSMFKIKCEPNAHDIREVEVTPPKKDSLITFMNFMGREGLS